MLYVWCNSVMFDEDSGLVEVNHNLNESYLFIIRKDNAEAKEPYADTWFDRKRYEFTKYQIKETDMRVKTATFTSPHYFDLTTGQFHCLIVSPYHENFSGILLKVEYDADSDMYNYQCQDMSRWFMTKGSIRGQVDTSWKFNSEEITSVTTKLSDNQWTYYDSIANWCAITKIGDRLTDAAKDTYRKRLSGLRPLDYYNWEYAGGVLKGNGLTQTLTMLATNKPWIELIRTLALGGTSNCKDVYVNKHGVVQVIPTLDKGDMTDEVHIEPEQLSSLKITFDTTNAITVVLTSDQHKYNDVTMENKDTWNYPGGGNKYLAKDLVGLDLEVIFGSLREMIVTNTPSTTKVASTTSSSSSTTTNKNGNPFNSKAKKAWVDADNGSGSFKSSFISELKKNGWTVKDGGTSSYTHYNDYFNVTSDYAVLVTIYNGFCAGTIREAYSSTIQNKLKNKGVQLVVVFDTKNWTDPQGMKPYRYGDFKGYSAGRAWDDNFSSSDPSISNVADFLKKNNAVYCAYPNVSGAIEQFLAGGYYKWKK